MPKTVPESKFTELAGLDRISQVVHEMKCIFREITKSDYGIDGEIEVCVPNENGKGYRPTGGIIKVQAKSGISYITQDTPSSFNVKSSKDDFEYWHNSNFPVIFIIYHPEDNMLYSKEMKAYLKSTLNVWQKPYRVIFDKNKDQFTKDYISHLQSLAKVSPPRISQNEKEKLFSNLLRISKMPNRVWSAPCKISQHESILKNIEGTIPPFKISGKFLYTFVNLNFSDCVFQQYCDTSKILPEPAEDFWYNQDKKRIYIYLLNQLLNKQLMRQGLKYNQDFDKNFFPREDDLSKEFKKQWYNIRTGNTSLKTVVRYYEYGVDKFWRHMAAKINIIMFNNSWFLRILPMYFFTIDGNIPWDSDKVGSYTTTIKAQETNQHVLNQVLFWSNALSGLNSKSKTIKIWLEYTKKYKTKPIMIINKMPATGITDFAITYDPATYEEAHIEDQMRFFSFFNQFEEDEDEY